MSAEGQLSLKDTNVLKGVALLLLLWHHLFYKENGLYDDLYIAGHGLVNELGIVSKVCVAIFVFLSGYGLVKSSQGKEMKAMTFYWNRMSKLLLNYWVIWLLFVPIGVFLFGRTFELVYVNHIPIRFLLDFGGLSFMFGFYGYNATWWFMSCIIMLYMLYPLLWFRGGQSVILLVALTISVVISLFHIPFLEPIRYYLMTFIVGMIVASTKFLTRVRLTRGTQKVGLFLLFVLCVLVRNALGRFSMQFDTIICMVGIVLYSSVGIKNKLCLNSLEFIGRHSMNVFLFHTFVYYYYFRELIYAPRNPILIFLLLLGICLIVSVLIEKIKGLCHFCQLESYLRNLRN